jgi:hypothetical protein
MTTSQPTDKQGSGRSTVLGKFPPASAQEAASTGVAGTVPDGIPARSRGALPALRPADGDAFDPLLADAAGLRANWQRVQSGFVDDPQAAVGDAADLVEHTVQALVGALRQRQRQLRTMWDRETGSAASGGQPDTEHLRMMMQRYRTLFNQICRP